MRGDARAGLRFVSCRGVHKFIAFLTYLCTHANGRRYAQSAWQMLASTLRREVLLLRRNKLFMLAGAGQVGMGGWMVCSCVLRGLGRASLEQQGR